MGWQKSRTFQPVRKQPWSGKTELEEAYGMDLAAPDGNQGHFQGPQGENGVSGNIRYTRGTPPTPSDRVQQRVAARKRANGTPAGRPAAVLVATKISDAAAVVTVALAGGGWRTVLVVAGGRTVEVCRDPQADRTVARKRHVLFVHEFRVHLGNEGIVDFSQPLFNLVRKNVL